MCYVYVNLHVVDGMLNGSNFFLSNLKCVIQDKGIVGVEGSVEARFKRRVSAPEESGRTTLLCYQIRVYGRIQRK